MLTNAKAQSCSCADLVKEVISKTEHDYAGYIHKVKEKEGSSYLQFKQKLVRKATNVPFLKCYDLLEKYVSFFNDGHLFIVEIPPRQPDSLAATAKTYPIPGNYKLILKNRKKKDPIEGIWRAAGHIEIVVVKTGKRTFYGVIQHTTAPGWKPGMVKMEIEKVKENEYKIAYYRNDFTKIHFVKLHISKHVALSFGVYRFAKAWPVNPESKYINPDDPQLPVFKLLNKNNVLLTIPSALIDRSYLDSLLKKNDVIIKSTPNLIIDVRSNGGGNNIWGGVYAIANTTVRPKPKTYDGDDFLLLASEDDAIYIDNMSAYLKERKDSLGIKYYQHVISNIRANVGRIIGFSFYSSTPDTAKRPVYKYPKRIAVIIDKTVASAGEGFIIDLKEISSKITLYGSNTYGMIDYMNVNTLPLGDKNCAWYYFGYPTFFAKDIKTKPNNPTGIKPDIYIPSNVSDWIEWVKNDLKNHKRN